MRKYLRILFDSEYAQRSDIDKLKEQVADLQSQVAELAALSQALQAAICKTSIVDAETINRLRSDFRGKRLEPTQANPPALRPWSAELER